MDHTGLKLRDPPFSASQVCGLKGCATTTWIYIILNRKKSWLVGASQVEQESWTRFYEFNYQFLDRKAGGWRECLQTVRSCGSEVEKTRIESREPKAPLKVNKMRSFLEKPPGGATTSNPHQIFSRDCLGWTASMSVVGYCYSLECQCMGHRTQGLTGNI